MGRVHRVSASPDQAFSRRAASRQRAPVARAAPPGRPSSALSTRGRAARPDHGSHGASWPARPATIHQSRRDPQLRPPAARPTAADRGPG